MKSVFRKLLIHISIPRTNFVSQKHNNINAANYVCITTAGYQNKAIQVPPHPHQNPNYLPHRSTRSQHDAPSPFAASMSNTRVYELLLPWQQIYRGGWHIPQAISKAESRVQFTTHRSLLLCRLESAVKVVPLDVIKGGGTMPLILKLGTRWRWAISFTPRLLKPRGNDTWNPLRKRVGGPHIPTGRPEKQKYSLLLSGIKPPIAKPVAWLLSTLLHSSSRNLQKLITLQTGLPSVIHVVVTCFSVISAPDYTASYRITVIFTFTKVRNSYITQQTRSSNRVYNGAEVRRSGRTLVYTEKLNGY